MMDCHPAVYVATAVSNGEELVWDATVNCTVMHDDASWVALDFAYPLPEGSTLVDAVKRRQSPIERDGRIVGVTIYQPERVTSGRIAFSVRTKNLRRGPDARITPPLLEHVDMHVVAFASEDVSFEPRASLDPHARATAMAITLGDIPHHAYRAALNEQKSLGLQWDGPAVVLHATPAIREHQGIDGELVERAEKTEGVFLGVAVAAGAAVMGLVFLATRFKRRSDDEHAEATLRAEIDSL
ncbi:hypothetical protein LVJ94_35985 [Pendulispora rubella]|uniref:Uncharacterized protein n=1 Tax=Pendulispora rubella TaxID=2741070 RepID=A0ABZ2KW55_9BACT